MILFIVAMIFSPFEEDQEHAHSGHNAPYGPEEKTARHLGHAFKHKKWYGKVQGEEEYEPGHPCPEYLTHLFTSVECVYPKKLPSYVMLTPIGCLGARKHILFYLLNCSNTSLILKFFEPFSSLGSALRIGESSIHRSREPCDTPIFHQIPDLFSYLPFFHIRNYVK